MPKRQKLNFPTKELAEDLKQSVKGKGIDAFFTPPAPASNFTEQKKNDTNNKDESGALTQPIIQKGESVKEPAGTKIQPEKIKGSELHPVENTKNKVVKKKQISAWILEEQYHKLRSVHYRLNEGEGKFDKSDLVGLAIETMAEIIGHSPTRLSNIKRAKEYIQRQLDKIFKT